MCVSLCRPTSPRLAASTRLPIENGSHCAMAAPSTTTKTPPSRLACGKLRALSLPLPTHTMCLSCVCVCVCVCASARPSLYVSLQLLLCTRCLFMQACGCVDFQGQAHCRTSRNNRLESLLAALVERQSYTAFCGANVPESLQKVSLVLLVWLYEWGLVRRGQQFPLQVQVDALPFLCQRKVLTRCICNSNIA